MNKRRLHRKGMELSINFLVMLIMAITIFGFGIRFIYTLSSDATELQDFTEQELDTRIGELLCSGSDRVCIGTDRKTITKGKFDVFGIKVTNILNAQDFEIMIERADPPGYKTDNTPIVTLEANLPKTNPSQRVIQLDRNEERSVGFGIEVPKTAQSGNYIFNVRIKQQTGQDYVSMQKLYVKVP